MTEKLEGYSREHYKESLTEFFGQFDMMDLTDEELATQVLGWIGKHAMVVIVNPDTTNNKVIISPADGTQQNAIVKYGDEIS